MSLAEWTGERVEYAVQYDAPEEYAGRVVCICNNEWLAERNAVAERGNVHVSGIECHVVQRTVHYGEWAAS